MSGRAITKSAVNESTIVRIVDSTDGTPETGVVAATAGLTLSYRREGGAVVALTALNDLALLTTAHTDGGILHIGNGYYRVDPQDAAWATGSTGVLIFGGATGMVIIGTYHPLVDLNLEGQSAVDLKDFADDGYNPATNKVQGVVLVDTLTTYTGNTPQTGDNFARLGAPAGASVSADIAGVQSDTNDIQTRLPAALVGGRIDASVGAMAANTLTASALAADTVTEIRSLVNGTSDSGTTTTMVDAARTEADTDYWKGCLILFTSGTISGQTRLITAFDAATDTITFAPATTQAVATQTYEILAAGRADVHAWLGTVVPALVGGRIDTSVGAMAADVVTASAVAANAIGASELATDAVNEIADAILDRDMATGTDSGSTTVRTVRQALRFLRNKWSISGTTLTVTKEDDTTSSWTAALTATAGANPITASDPAGP